MWSGRWSAMSARTDLIAELRSAGRGRQVREAAHPSAIPLADTMLAAADALEACEPVTVEVIGKVARGSIVVLRHEQVPADDMEREGFLDQLAVALEEKVSHRDWVVLVCAAGPLPEVLSPEDADLLRVELSRLAER